MSSMLKGTIRWVCLVFGLKRAPKKEAQQQDQDKCSVRDCWGEMASRTREER